MQFLTETNEGLMIIDLSNLPNSISKTYHSNEFFGSSHNIFIDEAHGRLYTSNQPMQVLDLTQDPDKPTLLANMMLPAGGNPHDLNVNDHKAFLSSGNAGLFVYDFTDPQSPLLAASLVTNGYNHSSWISQDGSFLVVAEEVPFGLPMLTVDISDLASGEIEVIKEFKFPLLAPEHTDATPHNPYVVGDYAYVSYYEDGVVIFDISDPANPSRAAYLDTHPQNVQYNGFAGCWGVYPFLPSGNLLVSDMQSGLNTIQVNLPTTSAKDKELAIDYFAVSPNPTTGEVAVELHNNIYSELLLTITDMTGKLLYQEQVNWIGERRHTISIDDFAKGMYVLSVQNEEGISSKKIIKQ